MSYDIRLLDDDMRDSVCFEICWIAHLDPLCWIWTGPTNNRGYGHLLSGRVHLSHRTSYRVLVGPIADAMTLDHLCRRPLCFNPAHLEPVTNQENIRRAAAARKEPGDERAAFDRALGRRAAAAIAAILEPTA